MDKNTGAAFSFKTWLKKRGWIVILDIVIALALLTAFAYFHHGMEKTEFAPRLVSCRSSVVYKLESGFEAAFDDGDVGYFDFENRFVKGEPVIIENGDTTYYKDKQSEVTVTTYYLETGRVQVADVYVADIAKLQTATAYHI